MPLRQQIQLVQGVLSAVEERRPEVLRLAVARFDAEALVPLAVCAVELLGVLRAATWTSEL